MSKFLNYKYTWLIFISLISFALLVGELVNGRLWMHDLEVYYRTASRLLHGEELYRIAADGHYVYKYSPTAALYFIPFLLLPFSVAKMLYWALLTGLTATAFQEFYKMALPAESITTNNKRQNMVLMLAFLAVGVHLHQEWHLGQVNLLLLGIYIFLVKCIIQKKSALAGLFLALSLFIKPFGLIFFPYLLLKQKYRTTLYAAGFVLVLGLLPFLIYSSILTFSNLYASWFQELLIELKAKQSLLKEGNHTIFSVVARYTPVQHLLFSAAAIKIYQLLVLGIIGGLFLLYIRWGRHLSQPKVPELAFLIALIPLFAFTSGNAFLFTAPCIIYLICHYQKFFLIGKVTLVVACLFIGANIWDLVGADLYKLFYGLSVYSFGTLLLLVLLFVLRYKKKKQSLNRHHLHGKVTTA